MKAITKDMKLMMKMMNTQPKKTESSYEVANDKPEREQNQKSKNNK